MDILQRSRRSTLRTAFLCGGVVFTALGWALWRPSMPRVEAPSLQLAGQGDEPTSLPPLDANAFNTPVWTIAAAPRPPALPSPAPPPPAPLKLQLIGILREDGEYKAVLYDPDINRLFVVATGEEAEGHKIDRVAADAISIRDGALIRTLALKTGGGAS
jgi:hypothetical protein